MRGYPDLLGSGDPGTVSREFRENLTLVFAPGSSNSEGLPPMARITTVLFALLALTTVALAGAAPFQTW